MEKGDLFPNGYGRSWSEPLAVGRWNRFWQKMREPATTTDWLILVVATIFAAFIIIIILPALLA